MERKEKPIVPAKPRNLSVAEKARRFDRVVAEVTQAVQRKPIKICLSESDINETNVRNIIEDSMNETVHNNMDADESDIITEQFMK